MLLLLPPPLNPKPSAPRIIKCPSPTNRNPRTPLTHSLQNNQKKSSNHLQLPIQLHLSTNCFWFLLLFHPSSPFPISCQYPIPQPPRMPSLQNQARSAASPPTIFAPHFVSRNKDTKIGSHLFQWLAQLANLSENDQGHIGLQRKRCPVYRSFRLGLPLWRNGHELCIIAAWGLFFFQMKRRILLYERFFFDLPGW
ncbi:unnamed protein product [Periconia digitata]|uniref:Uncharacterized protein n=1 Tax=Periconia digitata TaxID=1303443 RepID=A0A9W4UM65_9PLEO|nr:unnamed protein product [Periconia digitata]